MNGHMGMVVLMLVIVIVIVVVFVLMLVVVLLISAGFDASDGLTDGGGWRGRLAGASGRRCG